MSNKILNILYFIIIILFLYFLLSNYFSEKNVKKINKNRTNLESSLEMYFSDLPILKNDTKNIINYNFEDPGKNKIKKRGFWDLLKINE